VKPVVTQASASSTMRWKSCKGVFETLSNVQRLHSFNKFKVERRTVESKARLTALGSVFHACCHQSLRFAFCCGARVCSVLQPNGGADAILHVRTHMNTIDDLRSHLPERRGHTKHLAAVHGASIYRRSIGVHGT
jgi:hypothetical protein